MRAESQKHSISAEPFEPLHFAARFQLDDGPTDGRWTATHPSCKVPPQDDDPCGAGATWPDFVHDGASADRATASDWDWDDGVHRHESRHDGLAVQQMRLAERRPEGYLRG
jgi:hypothetical protein